MKLTSVDIVQIRALKEISKISDKTRNSLLRAKEAELSDSGKEAWFGWTSNKLSAELRKWRNEYVVELTNQGFRAFRWIKNRKEYAKRPTVTCMTPEQANGFRGLIRD